MEASVDNEFAKLRSLLSQTQKVRVDDFALNASIFQALSNILSSIQETEVNKTNGFVISAINLQLLEDVCNGKDTTFIKSFQAPILSIYTKIIEISSGYIVRLILNSMIILSSGKVSNNLSRECAVLVVGIIMEAKFSDCGSQVNEAVQCLVKLCKATSDGSLKASIFKSLLGIVIGGGVKISDLHQEIIKLATKFCSDKSPEVRYAVAVLFKNIVKTTSLSSTPTDILLAPAIKGLEDEVAIVQEAFAVSLASIFIEQISNYSLSQEQAKYGMARGSVDGNTLDKKSKVPKQSSLSRLSISKLKELTTTTKKVVEDYEFKSVVGHIIKQFLKFNGSVRSGYLFTLGYLIREFINQLEQDDFDWTIDTVLSMLHDPVFSSLTYEENTYIRVRISYLIRSSIASSLSEVKLITFASQLCKFISNADTNNRTDSELQLVLSELENVINSLGPAAIAIVEEVNTATLLFLRHSSFAVRSAATYVLSSLSVIAPGIAAEMLRNALAQTRIQAKQLVQLDASESMNTFDISALDEGIQSNSAGEMSSSAVLKKKNPKEVERLQRMFYFHGNTLVISVVLKNIDRIPTGLSHSLILDIFDLGLELLQQDTTTTSMIVRHVSCSIVRAGSLIVSSCISLGGHIARCRLKILLQSCFKIFQIVNKTSTSGKNEELIYEIMSLEAALVCISTLILFCPDEVKSEETCLPIIVEGLEISLRALKGKYQNGFRTHFRFRTLHVILLECFSWLPFGSFPNSVQQVFVEALRVFRDCIAAEYECSCLSDLVAHEHKILRTASFNSYQRLHGSSSSAIPSELLMDESSMVLKLEQNVVALQKKESEAFLAAFGKNNYTSATTEQSAAYSQAVDMMSLSIASCAQIDSRTVDSSILLLASTFSLQSSEYQDKAIQLFCQAVQQFSKPTPKSMGLFSSDEDKKKKDRRMYLTVKNVSSILVAIVRLFPSNSIVSIDTDTVWFQSMSDLLFELLGNNLTNIRCSASVALALFIKKSRNPNILQTICIKIRSFLMSNLIKKGETMIECSGYVLSLSSLWCGSKEVKDVRSVIMTTVFDCLRKQDCASSFKAYSFLSLSIITKDQLVNYIPDQSDCTADAVDLLDKIIQVIDLSVANITLSEDIELFHICLLRLLNVSISFAFRVKYNPSKTKSLLQMWNQLQSTTSNKSLLDESLNLFVNLIPHDIDGIYSKFVFQHLLIVTEKRNEYSIESLSLAFEKLDILVFKFPTEACEMGIPKALFEILDMCFTCFAKSSLSTYSGIEIKRGQLVEETQLNYIKKLEVSVTNTLYSLIQADVKLRANQRVSYWILFCRSIALNLKSVEKKKTSNTLDSVEEGENDFSEDNNEDSVSNVKAAGNSTKNKSEVKYDLISIKVTNYQTLSLYMREYVGESVPEFEVCRIQIKFIAIKCVILALSCVKLDPIHFDLGSSRLKTNGNISNIGTEVNSKTFQTLPIYVSLFLNDLINLSCATATYTINDKPILSLQIESMKLIKIVVESFSRTNDPDNNQNDNINEEKLLSQFISQILGAVRLSLSTPLCNDLYLTTGLIICKLVQYGFLNDKVVARRLFKSLLQFCEDTESVDGTNKASFNQLKKLLKTSPNVSEENSTCSHIFGAIIAARLLILSGTCNSDNFIHESVKATILSSINENREILSLIWMSVSIDCIRISQSDLLYQQNLSNLSDLELSDMILNTNNIENHPTRGGFTYPPSVNLFKLRYHFDNALPFVIVAYSMLPNKQSDHIHIFSLSCIVIRRLFSVILSKQTDDISFSDIVSDISMVLRNLSNLINIGNFSTSGNLLLSEWDNMLQFIVRSLKLAMNKLKSTEFSDLLISTFDCFHSLSNSLISINNRSAPSGEKKNIQSCVNRIWNLTIRVSTFLFPFLFVDNIDSESDSFSFPCIIDSLLIKNLNFPIKYSAYQSLNRLIKCLFNLAQYRNDFRNYTISLYVRITFFVSMTLSNTQEIVNCEPLHLIAANTSTLCQNLDILTSQKTSAELIDDLSNWIRDAVKTQNSFDVVFDAILRLWKSMIYNTSISRLIKSNHYRSIYNPPFAYQLSAIVMDKDEKVFIIRGVINGIIKFIQDNISEAVGLLVMDTFASSFICRIAVEPVEETNFDKPLISDMRSLIVKGLMLMFSVAVESKRSVLIDIIIPPLCANMIKVRNEDRNYLILCGKVLSHMARQSAEAFRTQVSKLSDADKNILQEVMIQAIQQSGPNYSNDPSNNVNNNNNTKAMKIDLAKYKK